MRKFLVAAAASLLLFGGQAQASPVEDLGKLDVEIQDVKSHGKWAHFRDKHLLERETENERRDREDWERRHRDDYYRHRDRHRDDYYYRDRERHRDDYRYYPPPPRRGYDYPPPPPPGRGHNYPPPPNR